jgi:signal peptidase I
MLARLLIIPSTVLCVLAIGYVVFTTGIGPRSYSNPSGSMAPTIVTGDMIFASGGFYPSHTPIPGDIVLFNVPREGELTTCGGSARGCSRIPDPRYARLNRTPT